MARSVQSESGLVAGIREHPKERCCRHRLLNVVPIVSTRVEGGYAARCLLCGTSGAVRGNAEAARGVLLEQMEADEE
jgi:hypothetical protein